MRYNLTKRDVDIKNKYKNKQNTKYIHNIEENMKIKIFNMDIFVNLK